MASPTAAPGSPSNGSTQGSSQNTSASRRTRSVGTKLSDEEYAQLESLAAARGVTPGEWVRELVLEAFDRPAAEATVAEQTVLSEVLALRTILINTIYDQGNGGMTPERMRELIAKADAGKLEKALERLQQNSSATENGR